MSETCKTGGCIKPIGHEGCHARLEDGRTASWFDGGIPAPSPDQDDWNEWATLANDVTRALASLAERPSFAERKVIAETLWRSGYRPPAERVDAEVEKERVRRKRHLSNAIESLEKAFQ